MAAAFTAPLSGSAPLTFTWPPAAVIAIGSAASLVTVSVPPATFEVTAALAMPGNARSTAVAAPTSAPVLLRVATCSPFVLGVQHQGPRGAGCIPELDG